MTENVRVKPLTGRQRIAVMALLSTGSSGDAAFAAGVTERTLRRWKRNPVFREGLHSASSDVYDETICRLKVLAAKAVATLADALDGRVEQIQLQSAQAILRYSSELVLGQIESRLTALEQSAGR